MVLCGYGTAMVFGIIAVLDRRLTIGRVLAAGGHENRGVRIDGSKLQDLPEHRDHLIHMAIPRLLERRLLVLIRKIRISATLQ